MAYKGEPMTPEGDPLYFDGNHNTWFERHHALQSGSVANAYRQHLSSSANIILSELLPTTLVRRNAVRENNSSSGKQGTAGVSGVGKRSQVRAKHTATFGTAGISGVRRSNAAREKHQNAGKFGTAGVTDLSRSNAVRVKDEHRVGKSKERRKVNDLIVDGVVGSFTNSGGARRSSRVAGISPETSPTFDQFEDPPM